MHCHTAGLPSLGVGNRGLKDEGHVCRGDGEVSCGNLRTLNKSKTCPTDEDGTCDKVTSEDVDKKC